MMVLITCIYSSDLLDRIARAPFVDSLEIKDDGTVIIHGSFTLIYEEQEQK